MPTRAPRFEQGTPTIQAHRVSRNLADEAAAAALDALLVQHGLTDFRPDGLVKSKFFNAPDDPVQDAAIDARDGALYNIAVQGPAAAASWTGEKSMAVGPMDKLLILLICDCWHNEPSEPLLQPGAIDSKAKHDSYCELRKRALAEGFDAATFEARQLQAFRGVDGDGNPFVEAGRLCCVRIVAATSAQLVTYGKYRPSAQTATSAETGSTQELTGASRCGLKMCSRFSEVVCGGWEIARVQDRSMSRAALPPGAPHQARLGINTPLCKADVNIAWRSAVALHRAYGNAEGEVAARYEQTKTAADVSAVNARLPSRLAFETRLLANAAARQGVIAALASTQATTALRTAEALQATQEARDPRDETLVDGVKEVVRRTLKAVAVVEENVRKVEENVRKAEDAAAAALWRGAPATLESVAGDASKLANENTENATAGANRASEIVATAVAAARTDAQ